MLDSLFIQNLFSNDPGQRFYFLAVVITVVISIVLHELAHGWAALWHGDNTPMRLGRMTGNPLVHMGPWSLLMLAISGIAWGQMPIDRTRMRGKHAEAIVAAAGPAMNVALALAAMTTLAVLMRIWGVADYPPTLFLIGDSLAATSVESWQFSALRFTAIAGVYNLLLAMFNLLPIPPLDGSHILGNYSRKYADFVGDPRHQGFMLMLFIFGFMLAGRVLVAWIFNALEFYVGLLT